MATTLPSEVSVDRARQALCRHVEHWCEQGVSSVRIRVNTELNDMESVWFYGRLGNRWIKAEDVITGSEFASLIKADLERLASSPYLDECQIRRKEFRDRLDFEIKFHHNRIMEHQGKTLGSFLYGILFHARHAAPGSRRQAIRRGPKRPAART